MDLDDRVARVVLAAEELLQLERGELGLDLLDRVAQLAQGLGVALLGQLEEDLRLVDALALPSVLGERVHDLRRLAPDGLRLLGVAPEAGGGRLLAQLGRAPLEAGEVKGASRARARARRGRARAPGAPRAASDRSRRASPPSPSSSRRTTAEGRERGERARPREEVAEAGVEGPHAGPADLLHLDERLEERALPPDAAVHVDHGGDAGVGDAHQRSEEHTSELQSRSDLVCRLLLEKKKKVRA